MPEPIALSWSGGKDSSLALAALQRDPAFTVVALVTSVTRDYDRVSIHGVRRALLDAQAAALQLPLVEVSLAPVSSNESYELAFGEAMHRLQAQYAGVRRVAFGDLFLEDVRGYREALLMRSGLEAVFPLWGQDTRALAESFIDDRFEAHLVCVDTTQLDGSFAGRRFDRQLLRDLPASVDPCGECGEFHTFVSDGPVFRTRVPIVRGEVVLRDERFAYCDLLPYPPA